MTPTTNGQDDAWLDEILDGHGQWLVNKITDTLGIAPIKGIGKKPIKPSEAKAAIIAHLDEAVRKARNQAIDDCIAVVRSKQMEDAEAIAGRMAALQTDEQKGKE